MRPNTLLKISSELLNQASKELDNEFQEGLSRTSIEKSYYYAFLAIREALNDMNYPTDSNDNTHSQVILGIKSICGIGYSRMLRSLRTNRNEATYNLSIQLKITNAKQNATDASNLISQLSKTKNLGPLIMNYL